MSYASNSRSHNHAPPSPPISQAQSPSPRPPSSPGLSRKRKQSEYDGEARHRPQRSFDQNRGKSTLPLSPFPIATPPSSSSRSSCSLGPSSRRGSETGASASELTTPSSSRRPMDIHNMLGPPLSQSPPRHPGASTSPHGSLDQSYS
ncbi:hypothetical protein BS47DRAFT_999109 [Hydnum rufescens UP504]|uniref:Uncharacterized protein n=1 Tax=Hydnum rufescens UP504 TaxID=1448309 RepID=A0A9P6B8P9_9AGAM|nr:hypothetical protein BS47DRAFT_999109 [Hydnum rufescens UP504]